MSEYSREQELKFNTSKIVVRTDGAELELVEEFKYLGVWIDKLRGNTVVDAVEGRGVVKEDREWCMGRYKPMWKIDLGAPG